MPAISGIHRRARRERAEEGWGEAGDWGGWLFPRQKNARGQGVTFWWWAQSFWRVFGGACGPESRVPTRPKSGVVLL
jgi:hypothetical protein